VVSSEHNFLNTDYYEYSASTTRNTIYCRLIAVIVSLSTFFDQIIEDIFLANFDIWKRHNMLWTFISQKFMFLFYQTMFLNLFLREILLRHGVVLRSDYSSCSFAVHGSFNSKAHSSSHS